jgi:hypothetical protein
MADDIRTAAWGEDLPICTNEEFEIGYRRDEQALEVCLPELAMEAAAR